jgi:hypothetical protein
MKYAAPTETVTGEAEAKPLMTTVLLELATPLAGLAETMETLAAAAKHRETSSRTAKAAQAIAAVLRKSHFNRLLAMMFVLLSQVWT